MVSVRILTFRDPKRLVCELCNQRRSLNRLALFHEAGMLLGDLRLCDSCATVLEDALQNGASVQEIDLGGSDQSLC